MLTFSTLMSTEVNCMGLMQMSTKVDCEGWSAAMLRGHTSTDQ